ncbi:very short patch repair endonuclease [Pedobacter sp. HDW13]|uniref:very short patch repair endonuclease n=1 Tax=Pedobacter sp. HDW13 TaxID=2714940 RepID=UPI001F0DFED1|nr:very short patch repair endonuclease [Pedobacter sp. HDW13]
MSRIRSKDTKAELVLRRALWEKNIRFRIHSDLVFGKPDIFIMKHRLAVFVDGSFWHGYNWESKRIQIKSNVDFWVAKIERNMERDRKVNITLSEQGFTVMRFWDHQVLKELPKCVNQVLLYIESCRMGKIPDFN